MRVLPLFLLLLILIVACRSAGKLQKTQNNISQVDTTPPVVVADIKIGKDTLVTEKKSPATPSIDIFKKVVNNKINFSYFNARVRVNFQGKEGAEEATAFIRMKKDSAVWLSLRGPLGIEGFRVLITRDSVKVMNLLKKNVEFRNISYLHEVTGIPFDFVTLQDLVVGNPVFIDTNIVGFKLDPNNVLSVLMAGEVFRNLITIDNTDLKILHSKLDDIDVARTRTCDITFSNYVNTSGILFSTLRKISVSEKSKLEVNLDFKQYAFNQLLTFPFNIPKNYKRLYL